MTDWPFDKPHAAAINDARLTHLASLGLPLDGRTVLEVGAGIGLLTGFFEQRGCQIVSTEARFECLEENHRRNPQRILYQADLEKVDCHSLLGSFDVVFCYGTLYHTSCPAQVLRELAGHCTSLFLLETCVNATDNGQVNEVAERSVSLDQSVHGAGCRPGRDYIWQQLAGLYPYVYLTRTQPAHHDYPLMWPATPAATGLTRAAFVASRSELELLTLSLTLLNQQERYNG